MKEHPILFSGPMVRAILEGRKTQTRRVIKPQPFDDVSKAEVHDFDDAWGFGFWDKSNNFFKCPYGQPGDRLWVREKALYWDGGAGGCSDVAYQDDPEIPALLHDNELLKDTPSVKAGIVGKWGWKPSIFMPRWASRITLEIVSVRVARLQDIGDDDAFKEGWDKFVRHAALEEKQRQYGIFKGWYMWLWDSINGKSHPWDSNPWVWVVEFKKL